MLGWKIKLGCVVTIGFLTLNNYLELNSLNYLQVTGSSQAGPRSLGAGWTTQWTGRSWAWTAHVQSFSQAVREAVTSLPIGRG